MTRRPRAGKNRTGAKIKLLASACALFIELAGRAETVYWVDNFETNAGARWTTNSVWKIGSPTGGLVTNVGGFRTHSISNGGFNWTDTRPAVGTNIILITTAADGVPPVTTNSFTIIVT